MSQNLRTSGQKPGFLQKYSTPTLNFSKKPGFFGIDTGVLGKF